MRIQVEYFGPARDWSGVEGDVIDLEEGSQLGTLIKRICELRPALASKRAVVRFAINQAFADDGQVLGEGDVVAVIPPVSGGVNEDVIMIVDQAIDRNAVREHVDGDPTVGGVAVFEGVTRSEEHPEHGQLMRLEYEAYREMAVAQMRRLADHARRQWEIKRLTIVHRIGSVEIGQPSVIIAVACGHRSEAFEACRYLIDTLKKEVPIWKKEIWAGGKTSWVDPTESSRSYCTVKLESMANPSRAR